jgi:hypothetical protein
MMYALRATSVHRPSEEPPVDLPDEEADQKNVYTMSRNFALWAYLRKYLEKMLHKQ